LSHIHHTGGPAIPAPHIAWDNSLAGRNEAGTGVYASEILRELKTRTDLRLEVFDGRNEEREPAGTLEKGRRALQRFIWTHWDFPRTLRERRFDLLHSPSFVIPFRCPCPSVVTIHDLTYLIFPDHFNQRWRRYVSSVMPSVLKAASAIICVSEHTKHDLLKYYDVSPAKVHVVYNGVDHARFQPGIQLDTNWMNRFGLRAGYILHVGSLSHRKNIPTLLQAIATLRSQGRWGSRQFVLAGSESPGLRGADAIHQTIRDLELSHHVVLAGHVLDDALPGLYANAALLVMPSLYEGFGLTVLESMAAGTPVVASNASCLPEVAGDAALFFSPHDPQALASAINEVLEQPSLAEDLRARGVLRAKHFSWERAASETAAVYLSVVRNPKDV
jgi:glycosyltransferase involved in cell wall biosynthesis